VYYELGWAQALGKPVIVTAKEGTVLPFDIFDVPAIFGDSQKSLRDALKAKIQNIAQKSGRQQV
jgi:nucleoside 2-deoxyribosyltransferase